jgi:hypothetical protein
MRAKRKSKYTMTPPPVEEPPEQTSPPEMNSTPIGKDEGPSFVAYEPPNASSPGAEEGARQLTPMEVSKSNSHASRDSRESRDTGGQKSEDISMTEDGPSVGGFTAVNR